MNKDNLLWDDAALNKMQQAPFFIRKFAKRKVEKAALEQGIEYITLEFVEKIRNARMNN